MKPIIISFLLSFSSLSTSGWTRVIAPSAMEVDVHYEAQFLMSDEGADVSKTVRYHSSHLFGLLQADQLVSDLGLDPLWLDGVGSPTWPLDTTVVSTRKSEDGKILVTYQAQGRILVHRNAYRRWNRNGFFEVPMPYDLVAFYDPKTFPDFRSCVDPNYADPPNFPYFYDWSSPKCQPLRQEPLARKVKLLMGEASDEFSELAGRDVPLEALHGDNGNGNSMVIYIAHGFDESAKNRRDEGRAVFNRLDRMLKEKLGFSRTTREKTPFKTLIEYQKKVSNRDLTIRSLLVNTDNDRNRKTFPRFWKEAIEKGDVVIYGGHSSEGVGPDIDRIRDILWKEDRTQLQFPKSKVQVYFFDACWSYSYYVSRYRMSLQTAASAIISYGLPSYYPYAHDVIERFLKAVSLDDDRQTWASLLKTMERALQGENYLINVNL